MTTQVIDLDAAIKKYGIRTGRIIIGPNGKSMTIVSVDAARREIILKSADKVYPAADLGRLAYNLLNGKGSVRG